jgi:hypothetical protein
MLLKPIASVFSLVSERKIIVACKERMAVIFLLCLGHEVEMFSELQFCELKDKWAKFLSPDAAPRAAAAISGDAHDLDLG